MTTFQTGDRVRYIDDRTYTVRAKADDGIGFIEFEAGEVLVPADPDGLVRVLFDQPYKCDFTRQQRTALVPARWLESPPVPVDDDPEPAAYLDSLDEAPSCSICDGLGHGYPGGGPCPLEMRGSEDAELDRRMEAARGVIPFGEAMGTGEAS